MPMATPEAQREYMRQWIASRRAAFFADKKCVECGSTEKLELDHTDPAQKVSHRIWSWSQKRRDVETEKCQVLCHDCHVRKSVRNRDYSAGERHGKTYLTEDQVREVKRRYAAGEGPTSIGRDFEMSRQRAHSIIKHWKYLDT